MDLPGGDGVSPRARLLALAALLGACTPPPPVADAGPDRFAYLDQVVGLEAVGAADDWRVTWRLEDGLVLVGHRIGFTGPSVGWHTVVLTVEDARGRVDTDTVVVRVGVRPNPVAPRVSSRIQPTDVGGVLVAVPGTSHVAEVFGTAVATRPTCRDPSAIAIQGGRYVVACEGDELRMHWSSSDNERVIDLPWGTRPGGLVWIGDQLRLSARGPETVQVLDEDGVLLDEYAVHAPAGIAITRGWTTLVSTSRGDRVARLEPDGEVVLSTSEGPDSDTDSRGVPSDVRALTVNADASEVVFGGHKANLARGGYRDGLPLTFETTARSVLRAVDPETLEERWRHAFDNRDRVTAVSFSAHGDLLYVGHGAGIVDILDAGNRQRLGGFTGFGAPIDALYEADGTLWVLVGQERRLYAIPSSELVGQAGGLLALDIQQDEPERHSDEHRLGERIFHASGDPRMSRDGYLSCATCHPDGEGDGLTWDFTDRGEGLRNTPSLRGRLFGPTHWTGNFDEVQDFEQDMRLEQEGQGFLSDEDWTATEDALEAPKAGLSAELDALATYLAELPALRSPWRMPDGTLTAEAEAGAAVFEAAGCAVCHPAPSYTDSSWQGGEPLLHDVGTLGPGSGGRRGEVLLGLDTPSLRGLWGTAPYLHDGSALTLREVLEDRNPGDQHGQTSDLSEDALAQLEAFLRQIE